MPKRHRTLRNQSKRLTALYIFLRLSVLAAMAAQFLNGNYENVFLCVLTMILFTMPAMLERRLRIDLPDTLEVIILLFIYAAEILGEIRAYYTHVPHWDTMLHTINGFLCAAIGFSLVDLLNRHECISVKLSPFYMAVVAFCFSMTVGVLWEFFEWSMDMFLGYDMQKDHIQTYLSSVSLDPANANRVVTVKNIADTILVFADGTQQPLGLGGYLDPGLYDTMKDLFVNFIGAVVFSVIGFFFVKSRGKGRFAKRFIPRVLMNDETPPDQTL